jgi:hypothetical protein
VPCKLRNSKVPRCSRVSMPTVTMINMIGDDD